MRYWWVNQNQTHRQEIGGGYLWSPKRKTNGDRNAFYEFMREVAPGDMVFSFWDGAINAIGVSRSFAYEAAKPPEFGAAGRTWNAIGWRVDVKFSRPNRRIRPVEYIEDLRRHLPVRYSPLNARGHGSQSIYLTELPKRLALALAELIGPEIAELSRSHEVAAETLAAVAPELVLLEEHLRDEIQSDPSIAMTEKEALIVARRGQGIFRDRVRQVEWRCRVTGVDRLEHLRASHCKPWRASTNDERLDGENGLLLTPSIDHLFDRGFISFRDDGRLLVSPVAHGVSLARMGVDTERTVETGGFTTAQRGFLEYHRDAVFLLASVKSFDDG